jgi:septal ring factor EnvC (AmiA/AmiB activator)
VERAETRKLAELDSVIGRSQGNLQSIRNQRSSLQKQAANHERAGRKVPDNLMAQISNLEKEEHSLMRDLQRFEKARADAKVSFADDRQRIAELLGQTR